MQRRKVQMGLFFKHEIQQHFDDLILVKSVLNLDNFIGPTYLRDYSVRLQYMEVVDPISCFEKPDRKVCLWRLWAEGFTYRCCCRMKGTGRRTWISAKSIFREWLPADFVWLGMMEAQCGMKPSQCMLPGSGISESVIWYFQMKQRGNVAETPRYPLIQASLAVTR